MFRPEPWRLTYEGRTVLKSSQVHLALGPLFLNWWLIFGSVNKNYNVFNIVSFWQLILLQY
jgi:hypothetical protein